MASAEGDHGSDFEETMFCEPCCKEGNSVEAEGFCSNCSEYLCCTCLKYHKRLARSHTLLDKSNMPQTFCFERCAVHPNDLVKFYCPQCDETACSECIPIKHQTECCEFKHIPSFIQSQDIYGESKDVKQLLKDVKEEAGRTKDEIDKNLKEINLNNIDISKSISIQKGYIKEKIEQQRVEIFKALEEERAVVIRQLDERQGRRKEQLFEQKKLINSKIDDEARHLDDQLLLYPKKMQNIALKSANININLESLITDIVNKERQGQKAELFLETRRVKRNMKTLQRDLDNVREENVARCMLFRPNKENISIDAMKNVSIGSLSVKNTGDVTKDQQGAYNTARSTELDTTMENAWTELSTTEPVSAMNIYSRQHIKSAKRNTQPAIKHLEHQQRELDDLEHGQWPSSSKPSNEAVKKSQRWATRGETLTEELVSTSAQMPENVRFAKISDKKGGRNAQGKTVDFAPEFANQLVAMAVSSADQAYITAKTVFKTWQDKQQEAKQQQQETRAARPKTDKGAHKENVFKPSHAEY